MTSRISPLLNGTYTIVKPDGDHRTLRIENAVFGGRAAEAGVAGAPGEQKRVLKLLVGRNNTEDYEGFAFVDDRGVTVWTRFRGAGRAWFGGSDPRYPTADALPAAASMHQRLAAGIVDLAWNGGGGSSLARAGWRVELAADCIRCGRLLTTPESIANGIGPECLAKRLEGR